MTPQEKNQLELPVSEDPTLPQLLRGSDTRHFLDHLIVLARHKSLILYFTAAIAVLSVMASFFLPKYYTSTAKILPPQQGQSIASAMLGELGQIGGLLGAVGGKDLLKNPGDLYVAMLKSNAIQDRLITRFNLMNVYHTKLRIDAIHRLEGLSEIQASKEGVISVAVEDRDPKRAAEIANAYIEELEKLTQNLAVTDAGKRRIFFEREAKVAQEQLEIAEQELKKTQEATGIIQLDNQSRVVLQAYEDLRAQLTGKELEIESMRSFATAENPDLVRLQHEREALRAQVAGLEKGQGGSPIGDIALEKVPERALKYYDKLREVTYRNSLLQVLLKQYEIARIDEARDAALIQVLDPGVPPEKKSSPKRAVIVISATLLALMIAVVWALLRENWERAKEDPQYLARLQLLQFYISSRHKKPDSRP